MEENSGLDDIKENNTTEETETRDVEENDNAKRLKTDVIDSMEVSVSNESDTEPSTSSNNCFPKAKVSKTRNYRTSKDDESSANEW